MNKRSKACDISMQVKMEVWNRDNNCCVVCGNPQAMPNAHYISRAKGGLGVEQNIVTLCSHCHFLFDNSISRKNLKIQISEYLKTKYENWKEENLIYKK